MKKKLAVCVRARLSPVYSPKNPPEDPLTDAISQGPQGVNSGGLGNIRIFEYLRYPCKKTSTHPRPKKAYVLMYIHK
jgi:hypothetical protein